ncbi:hypothetical protein Fmac_001520 [Flemingia macrophylla]|uniref:Uncharacterized protein n=1 Tax=Flemingia macrophylla TaxID=520843 RepID=A0ABD1NHB2_9FABA
MQHHIGGMRKTVAYPEDPLVGSLTVSTNPHKTFQDLKLTRSMSEEKSSSGQCSLRLLICMIVWLNSRSRLFPPPSPPTSTSADLGLRLVHVDTSHAEEIANTIMALFLGLLCRRHLISRHALSASGCSAPSSLGIRRCRGLILSIVIVYASTRTLATRSLAFKISVVYFDVQECGCTCSQQIPMHPSDSS